MERTRLYYEAQGFEKPYRSAQNPSSPFTAPAKPISESVLTLITTAALHERKATERRDVKSAPLSPPPPQLFANDLAWDRDAGKTRWMPFFSSPSDPSVTRPCVWSPAISKPPALPP